MIEYKEEYQNYDIKKMVKNLVLTLLGLNICIFLLKIYQDLDYSQCIAIEVILVVFMSVLIIPNIYLNRFQTTKLMLNSKGLYIEGNYFGKPYIDSYIDQNKYYVKIGKFYRRFDGSNSRRRYEPTVIYYLNIFERGSDKIFYVISCLASKSSIENSNKMVLKMLEEIMKEHVGLLKDGNDK
jgi:hypothetical protein